MEKLVIWKNMNNLRLKTKLSNVTDNKLFANNVTPHFS